MNGCWPPTCCWTCPPRPGRPRPRALPRDIAAFTGRWRELARLLDGIDGLATGAFTLVPHRVVTFVPRDAEHLTADDVDHGRVAWVFLGSAAELGVAGVLFGAGQEAEAIGVLGPRATSAGWSARACSGGGCTSCVGARPGQLRLGPPAHRPCLRDIAWRRENAVSPPDAELADAFCSVGDKPLTAAR